MIERRVAGEPLELRPGLGGVPRAAARGRAGGVRAADPDRLLVEQALAAVPARPAVVVDLCCGYGAIGAALAAPCSGAPICTPWTWIRRRFGVRGGTSRRRRGARCSPATSFDPLPSSLRGRVDLLVANTPYVPTDAIAMMPPEAREHEARAALDGGADGLACCAGSPRRRRAWLAPGGHLLVEIGESQVSARRRGVHRRRSRGTCRRGRGRRSHRGRRDPGPMSEVVDRLVALADPERAAGMAPVLPDRPRAVRRGRRVPRAVGPAGDGGRHAAPRAARRGSWRSSSRTGGTRCGWPR